MRKHLLVVWMSWVCACSTCAETRLEAPASTESRREAAEQVERADDGDEIAAALTASASVSTIAQVIEARLGQAPSDGEVADRRVSVQFLESINIAAERAHVFRAAVERSDVARERSEYVVVAVPGESQDDDDEYLLQSLVLGTASERPVAEATLDVSVPTGLRVEEGRVRMEFSVVTHVAEYATDGTCEERRQADTIRTDYTLVCGNEEDECVALVTSLSVTQPGYSQDCEGRRGPDRISDAIEPFAVSVEITGSSIVLSRISGSAPPSETFSFEALSFAPHLIDRAIVARSLYLE